MVQAIPTYYMGCFTLPKRLLKQLKQSHGQVLVGIKWKQQRTALVEMERVVQAAC